MSQQGSQEPYLERFGEFPALANVLNHTHTTAVRIVLMCRPNHPMAAIVAQDVSNCPVCRGILKEANKRAKELLAQQPKATRSRLTPASDDQPTGRDWPHPYDVKPGGRWMLP